MKSKPSSHSAQDFRDMTINPASSSYGRLGFAILIATILLNISSASAQTINQKVATYLESNLSKQIGGGECAHAAAEALRASGAEFYSADLGADFPSAGDYVWGTLMKVVSVTNNTWTDSSPATKLLPGDVLQYGNTRFNYGTYTTSATRHTTIVATVDSAGLPTQVYEQNFSGDRTVKKRSINLKKLTSGWIRAYRPKARKDIAGKTKFTITNLTATSTTLSVRYNGTSIGSASVGKTNTASAWVSMYLMSSSSTVKFSLVLPNGRSITATNAAGYEIYTGADGTAYIRKNPL